MPNNTETVPVVPAELDTNWHTVEFTLTENGYSASIDGKQVLTGKSDLPCTRQAILRVWRGDARFRDVRWKAAG